MSEPSADPVLPMRAQIDAGGTTLREAVGPPRTEIRSRRVGLRRETAVLLVGFLLGALSVGVFHWHRTGGVVGERGAPRSVAAEWASASARNDDAPGDAGVDRFSRVASRRAGAAAMTQVGLMELLGWQRVDSARAALAEAAAAWTRDDAGSAVDVAARVRDVLADIPAQPPSMRLVDLLLAVDSLPVRPVLAPVSDDAPRADQLLPRWLSSLIVIERRGGNDALQFEHADEQVRVAVRVGVLGMLEAVASGDVDRYRRHLTSVRASLGRDFASTPRAHSAQAALRWIDALPLEALAELARVARGDTEALGTWSRP